MSISKRDAFSMTEAQARAGKEMWRRTSQQGRLANSSFDAEEMAPKTWIMWVNSKGEEISTVECEIYTVPRKSDSSQMIGMLIGMCPRCSGNFLVREDNKQMSMELMSYRKAPKHLRINWAYHCKNKLGRPVMDDDKIPVISSGERWACDYCREWCVRVTDGIAMTDMSGVTQFSVATAPPIVGENK